MTEDADTPETVDDLLALAPVEGARSVCLRCKRFAIPGKLFCRAHEPASRPTANPERAIAATRAVHAFLDSR